MRHFSLVIQSPGQRQVFDEVRSFVGEDPTGSFGILSGHIRMMTSLVMGLSRFQVEGEDWRYVATPGALLYFVDDTLTLTTRRFAVDADYTKISHVLHEKMQKEEVLLSRQKHSFRRMEEEVLKRLWEMNTPGA
ncbi:hypothetical protein QCB45_05745 [Thiomicrorhabdus sp. ZW0627]|uniref:F0F1 ATP synthase subunit epsilon n=1 Tax=Thiomicrorhabdus sp. ZW0627 TaxID=3039774 RepID=UPI002436EB59|nr:hypothetical protein [Thiomicrorhabdus sp. ZW0627]MDG6773827.1 hypothetical protein [Thiomicrorhabdus sp. ZW0627]